MAGVYKFSHGKPVGVLGLAIFWHQKDGGRRTLECPSISYGSFRIRAVWSRVFTVLPAVEFLAARLRPVLRMQYVVDHLNQLRAYKGLLNECPPVVENQKRFTDSARHQHH